MAITEVLGNAGSQKQFGAMGNGKFFKVAPESGGGPHLFLKIGDNQAFNFTYNTTQSFDGGAQVIEAAEPNIVLDF